MRERVVEATRRIDAPAAKIFDYLARPANHAGSDGSGTVRGVITGPERLYPGARFRMQMHMVIPYTMTNEVVAFEEGREIAWRHRGRHVWRYRLTPNEDGSTTVTESFEWGAAPLRRIYELTGVPARNRAAMEASLERLAARMEQA
jgi:uncharacterized protein YndB with AHSA1/START domain